MAHHIAELIGDAENANVEEQPAKMRVCSEAILNLWKHRHELPNGKRPFEKLEPALRALESLDPDDETPRYFGSVRAAADSVDDDSEAKSWLTMIDGLDHSARILIRYCLTKAAQAALDKSAEWVALAKAAGAEGEIEFPIIRVVVGENDLLEKVGPDEIAKKQLQDRISRLEGFIEMANRLIFEMRQRVQQTPPDQ